MTDDNKITVPFEVTASEAMAENNFLRNRNLVLATHLHNQQVSNHGLQSENERLNKQIENMAAEIERLTAKVNAPPMPISQGDSNYSTDDINIRDEVQYGQ